MRVCTKPLSSYCEISTSILAWFTEAIFTADPKPRSRDWVALKATSMAPVNKSTDTPMAAAVLSLAQAINFKVPSMRVAVETTAVVPCMAAAVTIGPVAVASVMSAQGGLVAAVLGFIFLHERLARVQYVGVALTCAAVALLAEKRWGLYLAMGAVLLYLLCRCAMMGLLNSAPKVLTVAFLIAGCFILSRRPLLSPMGILGVAFLGASLASVLLHWLRSARHRPSPPPRGG